MKGKTLGHIFLVTALKAQPVTLVRAAADKAKIPEEFIRETKDFNAIKRAIRKLVDQGIAENLIEEGDQGILRDKILDTEERCSFQLSARWLQKSGVSYEKACIITFYKQSGNIDCEDREIRRALEKLLEECKLTATTTDMHKIAYKLCETKFRRIMLRDGIHFCPKGHEDILVKLKTFYKKLGARFWCQPIGQNEEDEANIAATVIDDMKQHIDELRKRLQEIKDDKKRSGITARLAKNAFEELRHAVEKYRELAESIRYNADKLFHAAGDAGDILAMSNHSPATLIAMAKQGRNVSPVLLELSEAAETDSPVLPPIERQIKLVKGSRASKKTKRIAGSEVRVLPMIEEAV